MCGKFILLTSFALVLALAGGVSAYDVGTVLKCDAEGTGEEVVTQAGWTRIVAGWNLDVNDTTGAGSGITVKLETGNRLAIAARNESATTPAGPLKDVEADFYFANDENKSPGNDFILTLSELQAGVYRVKSYLHRTNEPDKLCYGVTVTGAASVINVPPFFMQDHAIMELPAEIVFEASAGEDVVIRYKGPDYADPCATGESSPQIYFNGFILEYFGASNPLAHGPSPADRSENLCPGLFLSWTAGEGATSHDIYFGTSSDAVTGGASPVRTGWGSTTWTPPSVDMGKLYYWRIDENNGGDPCAGMVWRFTTNDGKVFDLFPGDGWRGIDPNVVLSWSPGCLANLHDVYLGTNHSGVESATTSSSVYMGSRSDPNYDPGGLEMYETYYWRIDEVGTSQTWKGEVLSFKTGPAGVAMYYKFDDVAGVGLPATLPDDTGSVVFTRYLETGSLEYGESNPVVNEASGTSADFDPNVGLYREDTGENDVLRLDGYQYTIEMWMKARTIPDITSDRDDPGAVLFAKSNSSASRESLTYSIELRLDRGLEFFHRGIFYNVAGTDDRQSWRVSSGRGSLKENEWYHIAAVFDITDPETTQKLYIDGQQCAGAYVPFQNTVDPNAVGIGMDRSWDSNSGNFFDGLIDELRVSTMALEPEDFLLVPGPQWARNPDPANRQTRVDPNLVLSWVPGISADTHDVYLGTSYDDVKNATTSSPEYRENVDPNRYPESGLLPLEYGTTHYWRVDEVSTSETWKGVVWRFRTRSVVDDPNVILWYEFDETKGFETFDLSGHDYIGDVWGDEDGWDPNDSHTGLGGCRNFDDDTSVLVEADMLGNIFKEISISVWLKDAYRQGEDNWVFDSGSAGDIDLNAAVVNEDRRVYWRAGNTENDVLTWDFGGANPETVQGWHHWVFIKNENEGEISIYFDGDLADSNGTVDDTLLYVRNTYLKIGAEGSSDSDFEGKMDDLRIFDFGLSAIQVELLFRGGDLTRAWGPHPFDGESDVLREATLAWRPGNYTVSHDLYFGTDFNDVNEADTSSGVYVDNRIDPCYDPPGYLKLNTTYYWRVDEVNDANIDSPWKGKVWGFTAASFVIIDDMESYNQTDNWIHETWLDGFENWTGGEVYVGVEPINPAHGGDQSMIYLYYNDGGVWNDLDFYSEIEVDTSKLPIGSDWTEGGVKILTLFFDGNSTNDANEQMYVVLEDTAGNYAQVDYGYYVDEDVNDVKDEEWHEWNVALSDFTDVILTDVKKLYIGFGIRGNPNPGGTPGGSGIVYFDDVRVYLPKCVPERLKPLGDFTDDCKVDFDDVRQMAREWLRTELFFDEYTDPGTDGLVGWWKLDEGDGNDITDSSIYGNNGKALGDYEWVRGHDGPAVEFSNGKVLVPDDGNTPELRPLYTVSTSAWIYYSEEQDNSNRVIVKGADNKEVFIMQVDDDDELSFFVRDVNDNSFDTGSDVWRDEWIHVAGTFDGDSNAVNCYVNGRLADSNENADFVAAGMTLSQDTNDLAIGNRSDANDRNFEGTIDDVRVYERALSAAEVAWLASDGTGYVPLRSEVNIYDEEATGAKAINFKDFALLMDDYGKDALLWPPEQ